MKFYKINTSNEKGNSAILAGFDNKLDWDSPHFQGKLERYSLPNFEPVFSKLIFKRGYNKPVDFINPDTIGGSGFIISDKIKNLLSNFKLIKNQVYRIPDFEFKNSIYKYYYLQLVVGMYDYSLVDFKQTQFLKTDFWGENQTKIEIIDNENYKNELKGLDTLEEKIVVEKLVLKKLPPDIFCIDNVFDAIL